MKKCLLAVTLAAVVGSFTAPAVGADIIVNIAPPPPRFEAVPAPRHGYVWAPGHWEWNGRAYHWVGGRWVGARAGYRWSAPQWVERGGRWYYEPRGWARDRDHDGVPNRFDRDRDGDGIPNRLDRHPNNPRRP